LQDSFARETGDTFGRRRMSRRKWLAGMAVGSGVGLIAPRSLFAAGMPAVRVRPAGTEPARPAIARAPGAPRHLAWVWQFQHDGDPGEIRDTLAAHGLGVVLKTHDGVHWMGEYDKTSLAVTGPRRLEEYANYFEQAGVPFHAWAVVKGRDAAKEAALVSDVLNAGARSIFLDLEGHPGFWVGTDDDASRYGEAVRRAQPNARISTSIDPRPWEIDRIPLAQFAAFTDEIAPQVYWSMFSNEANAKRYVAGGIPIAHEDIGPAFILRSAMERLSEFGRPIHPIGDGLAESLDVWRDFIDESYSNEADTVSVWRYGVVEADLWPLLRDTPPRVTQYVVQAGDSLGAIASRHGTSVSVLAEMNGIANPNLIQVGQVLRLPGGGSGTHPVASSPLPPRPGAASGVHTVVAGDTLLGIALRYNRSLSQVAGANNLRPPYLIRIGQVLTIP